MNSPANRSAVGGGSEERDLTDLRLKEVQAFVARVLGREHQAAMDVGAPEEAREILDLAHLFANEMERADAEFHRLAFIGAVAHSPSVSEDLS